MTSKSTRQAFGESLVQLGAQHPHIVVLDADLSKSTKTDLFAKEFPSRFYEMGIAEANMIGTAAGLSFTGKLPFACSFGCFLTGRYDTIRLSVAYSQANVRLVGTHAGVGIGDDGHSQMGLEDISLMRALPKMGVFQPMDAVETAHLMTYLVEKWTGPAYLRLTRQALPTLFPKNAPFRPGKLMEIHNPGLPPHQPSGRRKTALCIATGACVAEAVLASKHLLPQGIFLSVWNAHSLKPFDQETLTALSQSTSLIVTVEDHSVIGGLGSVVAESLSAQNSHPPLIRMGIQDRFGESGTQEELYEEFKISGAAIAAQIRTSLERDL